MTHSSPKRRHDLFEDNLPRDFVLLLTPDCHIQERIEGEKFLEFVESALKVITEYGSDPPSTLVELQVGCALLPGNRLIVEVQTRPAEVRSLHAKGLTPRLRQLTVPPIEGWPVAFARRIRFGQIVEGSACPLPFASFVNSEQPISLDELLLEAGGVQLPSPSMWRKFKTFFSGQRQTTAAESGSEGMAAVLSRRTGGTVIASDRQLILSGASPKPFTIVEDKTASGGFALVKDASGASSAVDKLMLDYLQSRAPQPTQAVFDSLLSRVERVRVLEGGMANGRPLGSTVLLDIAGEPDLTELKQALEILDGPGGHCMCYGEPSLELLSWRSEPLAVLGIHHGRSVRWAAWKDDAELVDGRRLLDWLAQRGVTGPLSEFLEGQRSEEQGRIDWQRWVAAMPDCLKHLSKDVWQYVAKTSDLTPVQESLAAAYPEQRARILALFRWFGNGAGPWTGFPVYEQLAEQILLQSPVEELVDALQDGQLSEDQVEGAARFFAGWAFANRASGEEVQLPSILTYSKLAAFLPDRSGEPAPIPEALRRQLLAHCRGSSDEDKRRRAESAFAA